MPPPQRYTRRRFLVAAGLSAAAGGLACAAGIAGYLLLGDRPRATKTPSTPPGAPPTRPDRVKQIARPPVVARAQWGAREPDHTARNEPGFYSLQNTNGWREYAGDLRDVYRTVIVHHSVEYEENDLATVRDIQNLHMDDRGWADIAYHFVVGKSGQIFEGRALHVRGTHVSGYNTGSVGVVFLGDLHSTQPTAAQLQEGQRLINWLALRLALTHLAGHYAFNPETVCPGQYMLPHLAELAASAGLALGTAGYVPPPEQILAPADAP